MQASAAVINAGVGDISLALQAAGFKVLAAYEADKKALAVHRALHECADGVIQLVRLPTPDFLNSDV